MKLTKNMRNYEPLIIPLDKPIEELTKREAKEYFEWFLAHIDERADYLREKVSIGLNIPVERLDFSMESLKPIWKWFLGVAEITKPPKKGLKGMVKGLKRRPQSFIEHVMGDNEKEFSVFTYYVLRDIGMYVGKTFKTSYSSLAWTFKTTPRNYISVNEPLLIGFVDDSPSYPKPFYPDLEPISLAQNCALNIFDNTQQESDLYDICMKWVRWIPQN